VRDELRIHVFVFVRDVQNVNGLVAKRTRMLGEELRLVLFFHDEDDLRPVKVL